MKDKLICSMVIFAILGLSAVGIYQSYIQRATKTQGTDKDALEIKVIFFHSDLTYSAQAKAPNGCVYVFNADTAYTAIEGIKKRIDERSFTHCESNARQETVKTLKYKPNQKAEKAVESAPLPNDHIPVGGPAYSPLGAIPRTPKCVTFSAYIDQNYGPIVECH